MGGLRPLCFANGAALCGKSQNKVVSPTCQSWTKWCGTARLRQYSCEGTQCRRQRLAQRSQQSQVWNDGHAVVVLVVVMVVVAAGVVLCALAVAVELAAWDSCLSVSVSLSVWLSLSLSLSLFDWA